MKKFHYADVLSVTDGRLLSLRHMDGVYEVYEAVVGEGVMTHHFITMGDTVRDHLIAQHPDLAKPELTGAITLAVMRWRDAGAGKVDTLKPYLDKYVLPLIPSEYLEVTPMSDAQVREVAEQSYKNTTELFKGKKVVVVEGE